MTWEDWRPEIAKAVDGSHHTIESIEQELLAGILHAWIKPDCCIIVEFVRYPQALACQIMWAAGDLEAGLLELPAIEDWARKAGCTEMLVEGRAGWARTLRPLGYSPWSVTVRKALTDGL